MKNPSDILLSESKCTLVKTTAPYHRKNIDDPFCPPDSENSLPLVEPTFGPCPPFPSPFSQLPTELLTQIFALASQDDGTTGRSLSLVSRAFRETIKPVVLRVLNLHFAGHVSWLARLLATDPSAKTAVRHLRILLSENQGHLTRQEADWGLMPMGDSDSLVWDPVYWHFLDGDYTYMSDDGGSESSESSEDMDGDERADLLEDLAFFVSDESQRGSNLVYNDEGNLMEETIPPQPADEHTERWVANSIYTIIRALALVLQELKLTFRPDIIILPHCPELVILDINTPFLIHLDNDRAAFPKLKCLRLRGPFKYIDTDTIIFNAPVLTHLRVPFSEDRLHALVSALGLFPDSVNPLCRAKYRFEHMEHIALVYYAADPTGALSRLTGMISNAWEKTIFLLRRRMG